MQGETAFLKSEQFWVKAHLALRVCLRDCAPVYFYISPTDLSGLLQVGLQVNYECARALQAVEDQLGTQAQPDLVSGGDCPPLPPRVSLSLSRHLGWEGWYMAVCLQG